MADSRTDAARAFLTEVLGYVPPLTAEEVEHYRWLIGGLLVGSRRLLTQEQIARHHEEEASDEAVAAIGQREGVLGARPSRAVLLALDEVSDLFDELIARIPVAAVTRSDVIEEVR